MEPKDDAPSRPHTDVTILDGAVVVNFLKPLEDICSGLLVLISTYHLYNLEYPKVEAPLLKFLEEKLAAAPVTTKTGITYNNLFRSVTLLEQRTEATSTAH